MRKMIVLSISFLLISMMIAAGWYSVRAENQPAPSAVLTQVNTAFTYQGFLEDAGSPASGSYDFLFQLFDDPSAGVQVGGDSVRGDVSVVQGVFTASLDFGAVFDGKALWLQVAVRPGTSTGSYTILLPRQLLTGVPYALSLRPGAVIKNTLGSGHGLEVWSNAATHTGTSLWVENDNSTSGIALWARAQGTDATIVSTNSSNGALFKGFGGNGGEHEFIVGNNGDIWTAGNYFQALTSHGSVKAGAMVYCNSEYSTLYTFFNNVSGTMWVVNGPSTGYCYIEVGFDLVDQYWVTSNNSLSWITFPTCEIDPGNQYRFKCRTVDLDGNPIDGAFQLLVY